MSTALPQKSDWLFLGFRRYAVRYARKHFHAVRLSKAGGNLPRDGQPILVVMNHPSWWDPIIGLVLSRSFASAMHYAAIDSVAVEKYAFLKRTGFFGVDLQTYHGTANFLRTGQSILSHTNSVLWITAQGAFADVRKRPLNLRSGVGYLASRMASGWVLPIALEYTFWNESKPEALVRIGEAINVTSEKHDRKSWTALIEVELANTLDALALDTVSRDAGRFVSLIEGRVGIGGVYDLWRRSVAWATGRKFDASHGGTP